MTGFVYALTDNGAVFYVGKSAHGRDRTRLSEHIEEATLKRPNSSRHAQYYTRKSKRIRTIGLDALGEITLGTYPLTDLDDRECQWIDTFRGLGHDLTNMTNGGEGGDTGQGLSHRREKTRMASPRRQPILWNGTLYPSERAFSDTAHISHKTVKNWRSGDSPAPPHFNSAVAIETAYDPSAKIKSVLSHPIQFEGVEYPSKSALAAYIGISPQLLAYRMKNNNPLRGKS